MKTYFSELSTERFYQKAAKDLQDFLSKVDANGAPAAKLSLIQAAQLGKLKQKPFSQSLNINITSKIGSGNRIELINASTAARKGSIPAMWDKAKLPEGTIISVSKMLIGIGGDATITNVGSYNGYAYDFRSWNGAFANAELLISNSTSLNVRHDLAQFGPVGTAADSVSVERDGFEFGESLIFEDNLTTLFEIFCPEGVNIPATPLNQFIKIMMSGSFIENTAS